MMLFINPDCCTECEACALECPTHAIFHDDNVPDQWKEYIALNAEMSQTCPVITEPKPPLARSS
jgi:ferredoxin